MFARTARDCPEVTFLSLEVHCTAAGWYASALACPARDVCHAKNDAAPSTQADAEESQPLLDDLGIEVLPTVQFWKDGQRLWEHRGIVALQQNVGEGAPL